MLPSAQDGAQSRSIGEGTRHAPQDAPTVHDDVASSCRLDSGVPAVMAAGLVQVIVGVACVTSIGSVVVTLLYLMVFVGAKVTDSV